MAKLEPIQVDIKANVESLAESLEALAKRIREIEKEGKK